MDSPNALGPALFGVAAGAILLATLTVLVWLPRALRTPPAWLVPRPLTGIVARVVIVVPAEGVGRIAYTAGGKRCSMPAKNHAPQSIAVGTEVAVVALERGVAVVEPFHIERNPL